MFTQDLENLRGHSQDLLVGRKGLDGIGDAAHGALAHQGLFETVAARKIGIRLEDCQSTHHYLSMRGKEFELGRQHLDPTLTTGGGLANTVVSLRFGSPCQLRTCRIAAFLSLPRAESMTKG